MNPVSFTETFQKAHQKIFDSLQKNPLKATTMNKNVLHVSLKTTSVEKLSPPVYTFIT